MNEIRVSLLISLFHMHFKFWIFLLIMSGFFLLANAQISANNLSAESSNYTEGCQSIATISYEDRPNIDFTMVSTDTPEHSYPGVVHEYQMNIDLKDVNCGPVVQVDISSIAPVNDYCFVEGISFEAPLSQAKTDASSIINCTNACGQDSECVAQRFVQEYSNSKKTNITNQCYLIVNGSEIVPLAQPSNPLEANPISGYKSCTNEYSRRNQGDRKILGYDGPSSVHLFETNLEENRLVKNRKLMYPNIINKIAGDVKLEMETQVSFKALLAQSHNLMSPEVNQFVTVHPVMMITAGLVLNDDLLFVSIDEIKTYQGSAFGLGYLPFFNVLQRLTVESNLPKIWTASINSAMLLRIKIKTLVPQANLKFVIKQMGTQDAYYFGKPILSFHGHYSINNQEFVQSSKMAPSGELSHGGWQINYPNMMGYHQCLKTYCTTDDISDTDFISISVPITFLGFRQDEANVNKKFEYFIELGYGTQRYSETAEAFEELNPEQQQQVYPTIMNVSCEGNCTLRPGEMLEFNMMLSCPKGLNNFDFSARCTNNSEISPVSIIYEEQDYFGHFPSPRNWIYKYFIQTSRAVHNFQENNLLKVSFMVMAGFNASEGSYQCVFSTAKEMETLDLFVTGEFKNMSGESINITYSRVNYNMDSITPAGGEVAYDINLNIPYGKQFNLLSLNLFQANNFKMANLRVCNMKVLNIGKDLVCPTRIAIQNAAINANFGYKHLHFFNVCSKKMQPLLSNKNNIVVRAVYESTSNIDSSASMQDVTLQLQLRENHILAQNIPIQDMFNTSTAEDKAVAGHWGGFKCVGNRWISLNSGRSACFHWPKQAVPDPDYLCQLSGGYLGDVRPEEWYSLHQFFSWHRSNFANRNIITSGIATRDMNGDPIFTWKNTGKRFKIGLNETFNSLPTDTSIDDFENNATVFISVSNFYYDFKEADGMRFYFKVGPPDYNFILCMQDVQQHENLFYGYFLNPLVKRDNSKAIGLSQGSIGLITFKIKLRQYTQTPLKLTTTIDKDSGGPRICKIKIFHVGENMPCVQQSTFGIYSKQNSTKYTYLKNDSTEEATIYFEKLSNWGTSSQDDINDIRDVDTIEIGIFLDTDLSQLTSFNLSNQIAHLNGQSIPRVLTWRDRIKIQVGTKEEWNTNFSFNISVLPSDNTDVIVKGTCKRISIRFSPFRSINIWPSIENLGFDDGIFVTWCGFYTFKTGENFPCYNASTSGPYKTCVDTPSKSCFKTDDAGTKEFWRTTYMREMKLQYYKYINNPIDDQVELEVSIRVPDRVPNGTVIPFKMSLCKLDYLVYDQPPPSCISSHKDVMFNLTVVDFDHSVHDFSSKISKYDRNVYASLDQPSLNCTQLSPIQLMIKERSWINFTLSLPLDSTLLFNLSVMSETSLNRTLIHLNDIQFANNNNEALFLNALGVNDFIDIRSNYNTTFYKSEKLSTFAQKDRLFIDFGYMTNTAAQRNWFGYQSHFGEVNFQLQIELTDHPLILNGITTNIDIVAYLGEFVLKCSVPVSTIRNSSVQERKTTERPFLEVDMKIVNYSNIDTYPHNAILPVSTLIYHSNSSRGEGYPVTVRFIVDRYSRIDLSSIKSNYTGLTIDQLESGYGSLKLEFADGIMFPDVISLNFTLSLDSYNKRLQNVSATSSMFVTTSCLIPQIDGYPTSKTSCSVGHRLDIPLYEKPICERQILIPYPDCQIQSNMVLSSAPEHAAANILSETLAWSAPIRTGPKWEIYVQIDFRTIMRITRIFLGFPQTSRGPSKIRIDTSKNTNTFMKGETAIIRYDKKLLIKESIVARSIRLVVVETNDATPTLKAISINSVKFYGCPLYSPYNISENLEARMSLKGPERKKGVEWCASSQEITSDDPRQYRQFAVDTLHENIIYLCDVGEYKDAQPCWVSIRQGRWKALPLYIHSILGFSLEKGRMYLLDKDAQVYFSSVDGIRLEISRFENLTMLLPGWIPAVSVPGLSINHLNFAWPESTITANFYGLQQNGNNILNWQSCCINPN